MPKRCIASYNLQLGKQGRYTQQFCHCIWKATNFVAFSWPSGSALFSEGREEATYAREAKRKPLTLIAKKP